MIEKFYRDAIKNDTSLHQMKIKPLTKRFIKHFGGEEYPPIKALFAFVSTFSNKNEFYCEEDILKLEIIQLFRSLNDIKNSQI